ncbi:uncharacterized protein LOC127866935 [Dreissena polymorpha]|uniref:uncharacterized protein LOC127866935 n=1 Tax=Dreissena polymorpha TaxID=45954 RepID=UPI002264F9FC|nr:uncharacterized protein LOC127866935 [Dreissena polymorpha]
MADQLKSKIRINELILEYSFTEIWEEFKLAKSLSEDTVELLNVLVKREYSSNEFVTQLLSFLMVLYCLHESKQPIREEICGQGESMTPLEEMHIYWDTLVNFQTEEEIKEIGQSFVSVIKQAAVHACLRQGKKQLAQQVFDKMFTAEDRANDTNGSVKCTKKMIKRGTSNVPDDKRLVDDIITYLGMVSDQYATPALLMAEKLMNCRENAGHKNNNNTHLTIQGECSTVRDGGKLREPGSRKQHSTARKRYSRDVIQKAQEQLEPEDMTGLMERGNARLKQVWSKNNKKKFSESPERPSSSSPDDMDSQQETQAPPSPTHTDSASTSCTAPKKRKPSEPDASQRRSGSNFEPSKGRSVSDTTTSKGRSVSDTTPTKGKFCSDTTPSNQRSGSDTTPSKGRSGNDTTLSNRRSSSDSNPSNRRSGNDSFFRERPSHTSTPSTSHEFKKPKSTDGPFPGLRYRKNIGRPDRHKPATNRAMSDVSDIEDDNRSMTSSGSSSRQRWTWEETVEFYKAVKMIGVGKWSKIQDYLGTTRSQVQLKDKWRNVVKSGDAEKLKRELG